MNDSVYDGMMALYNLTKARAEQNCPKPPVEEATTPVLDVCCGSKMFYFDKNNPMVEFCDNRELSTTLCDGRELVIKPNRICDFRELPFKDNAFSLVVFDPPHLLHAGEDSWLAKKYGILPPDWQSYIREGFNECYRVLKPSGILLFKWNVEQIPFNDVVKLAPIPPLLGDKRAKTRWTIFIKLEGQL